MQGRYLRLSGQPESQTWCNVHALPLPPDGTSNPDILHKIDLWQRQGLAASLCLKRSFRDQDNMRAGYALLSDVLQLIVKALYKLFRGLVLQGLMTTPACHCALCCSLFLRQSAATPAAQAMGLHVEVLRMQLCVREGRPLLLAAA